MNCFYNIGLFYKKKIISWFKKEWVIYIIYLVVFCFVLNLFGIKNKLCKGCYFVLGVKMGLVVFYWDYVYVYESCLY